MYQDLTQGNITKTMIYFALPMITGNLLQQLYNIADTLIVGQVLGRGRAGGRGIGVHTDDISDVHLPGAVTWGPERCFRFALGKNGRCAAAQRGGACVRC